MTKKLQDRRNIVMDRCWSLAPLSALSALLTMLISKNSALFYVAFVDEFGVSRQNASWPLTLNVVMAHMAGLLVMALQERVTIYHIAVSGCLLNSITLVASAFVPNITWMTFTLGLINGTAVGMIMLTLSIYNMLYFDKYRATASGFKYTGMTLAPLAFPLLLSALIREYSLHGALLMLAAITLNTLPLAMLMNNPRPIALCCCTEFMNSKGNVKQRSCSEQENSIGKKNAPSKKVSTCLKRGSQKALPWDINTTKNVFNNGLSILRGKENEAYPVHAVPRDSDTGKDDTKEYFIAQERRRAFEAEKQNREPCLESTKRSSGPYVENSQYSDGCAKKACERCHDASYGSGNGTTLEECGKDVGTASSSDETGIMVLLRNPLLYILVATFTIGEYTTITLETTVLDYAGDRGALRPQAEPIITYVATAEMAGRLVIPFFWDRSRLSRCLLVAMCLVVEALCLIGLPHATSFPQVVATAVVTGLPAGCIVALKPVLLSDYFGVEKLSMCWGVAGVFMLPVAFGGPLLIGLFRDSMGSYENLYRMLAALCVTSAIVLFGLDIKQRREQKPTAVTDETSCTSVVFRHRSFDSGLDSRDI